mmetsp:Transcript_20454/g.44713  ORF Transcript_20454/g.44713 Transcript_20454/m.44713 type:complete len:673 (-) Transcript_20454:132-2150(-)
MPPRPPSRRTTLGPVTTNRRKSLGGNAIDDALGPGTGGGGRRKSSRPKQRMSMIPRMSGGGGGVAEGSARGPSPSRRKSMAPVPSRGVGRKSIGGGGNRRQSFAPGPPAVKADPRPLSDKTYVNSCIRNLLQYLVSSGYEYPVSHKTLVRPSGRDFKQICTFLLRRIDPSFNDGSQKFDEEVSLAFKTLGYPYPISKTALAAAGSPHTWPTLLAALTWLIELLGCYEADDDDIDDDAALLRGQQQSQEGEGEGSEGSLGTLEDLEVRSEKAFLRFLGDAYVAFLAGDDAKHASLEEALIEYFERDNNKIERDFAALTEKNSAISADIQKLLQNGEQLPELKKKREDHATELEKFYDLVKKLEEHKAILQTKVEERTAELDKNEKELESITSRIVTLKSKVETQEVSVEDVRMMQNEKARVEERIAAAAKSKSEMAKLSWEGDMELRGKLQELQDAVGQYNDMASKLLLIPETAENAGGERYEIKVQQDYSHDDDLSNLLGGIDLENSAMQSIRNLKRTYSDRVSQSRKDLSSMLDEQQACEEGCTEASDGVKILEAKAKKFEETLRREKEEQDGTLAVRLREIDSIETKIGSLRDPVVLEASIAKYQRQCTQLETTRQKNHEEHSMQKKAVQAEINEALALLAAREEHIQTALKELEGHICTREANLEQLLE